MASIYKPTYTHNGELRQTAKWYVQYTDGQGKRRRVPGFVDRKATEVLAAELERTAERVRAGLLPPEAERPVPPLEELREQYLKALADRGDGPGHVKLTGARLRDVLAGCGWQLAGEIDGGELLAWLAQRRREGRPKGTGRGARAFGPIGLSTSNHYIVAAKGFARWLAAEKYLPSDPLAAVKKFDARADVRVRRRVLSAGEFRGLVASARGSESARYGLCGAERATLYLLSAWTGLRASEIASLSRTQIRLDADPPSLYVEAAYSKRRRLDELPLAEGLLPVLREWLSGKPDGPLWRTTAWRQKGAQLLREDLERSGTPYVDAEGRRYDFHALRHQFITELATSGVSLVEAQKLARHSTPNLTANYYTHLGLKDLAAAVNKLKREG